MPDTVPEAKPPRPSASSHSAASRSAGKGSGIGSFLHHAGQAPAIDGLAPRRQGAPPLQNAMTLTPAAPACEMPPGFGFHDRR
jgi:hypothetical protein